MMAVYNSGRGERVVSAGIGVGDMSEVLKISEKELSYYLRQMKRHGYVELSPEGTSVCLTELGRITGAECRYRN